MTDPHDDQRLRAVLDERRSRDRSAASSVLSELADVVRRRDTDADVLDDDLTRCVRVATRRLGVQVRQPTTVAATVAERLRALGELCGLTFREVELEPGWWRTHPDALVAVEATTGRPMAVVRRWGRTAVTDGRGGRPRRVTAAVAAGLHDHAFQAYATGGGQPLTAAGLLRLASNRARPAMTLMALNAVLLAALTVSVPVAVRYVFGTQVPAAQTSQLGWVLAGLVIVAIVGGLATLGQYRLVNQLRSTCREAAGAAVIHRVTRLPPADLARRNSGEVGARILAVDAAFDSLGVPLAGALTALAICAANLVYVVWVDRLLGLVAIGCTAVAVAVFALASRRQQRARHAYHSARSSQSGLALEIVNTVTMVRLAGAAQRIFTLWAVASGRSAAQWLAVQRTFVRLSALASSWATVTLAAEMAALWAVRHPVGGSEFMAVAVAVMTVSGALAGLVLLVGLYGEATSTFDASADLLASPVENAGGRLPAAAELIGRVEVLSVRFRYAPESPLVLEDVSFRVEPGEFVALVGPSGSGKSTVFRLLLGFARPEAGLVTVDGTGVTDVDATSLRRQIGIVLQRGQLVSGSILTNLALNRSIGPDEAWQALEWAGVADEVRRMPMALHTMVGEGGSSLSGGQRQRILIARAMIGQPRLLLMDEATSALDNITQRRVMDALRSYPGTRIVVAHRLSTVRYADRILVLDAGHIVEEGTFDTLIDAGGTFARLARRQSTERRWPEVTR